MEWLHHGSYVETKIAHQDNERLVIEIEAQARIAR
jgi:hypothetical protein